ncbi:hypothetical protein BBJ28_00002663 [Nothophytophthora sp. Chile5]|nr:hypothetical protein BBJ28_00002663 [Nothophytophthora sp. Chile5]
MNISASAVECAVVAFGCNDDGQLGTGAKRRPTLAIDDVSSANFPKQLGALHGEEVVAVSCGSRHTMALTASGAVYSWGWGSMGQLGHGDLKSTNVPHKIEFFEQEGLVVDYISCGGCHSAAARGLTVQYVDAFYGALGTLYMWGEAHWGQLGLPKEFNAPHQSLPAKCPVLEEGGDEAIVKISCGGTHTAALTNQGRVYVWGRGDSGQLGVGSEWLKDPEDEGLLGVSRPHLLEGFHGEKVVQVACGAFHSAAVTEQGHVYIWGKEDYGMLGLGPTSDQLIPMRIEYFDEVPALYVALCVGFVDFHLLIVRFYRMRSSDVDACRAEAGILFHGRLGLTEMKSLAVPTCLDLGAIPVRQVSAGGAHSMALMHSSRPIFSPMISPIPTSNPIPRSEL